MCAKKRAARASNKDVLASVKAEMAKPRLTASARQELKNVGGKTKGASRR